ncbi:MAG: hypothetical protein NTZ03_06350, partial [Actinobacteria bacterium]|nr:hypothetical protein [Actinomycetota bacterium]
MSTRLTRRGAITLAVAGFLAPALVITASSALLTTTNTALSANSVSTTACSTSAWNTLLTGFGDGTGGTAELTAWNPFDDNGAGLWNGGSNNNAALATSGLITGNFSTSATKPTVNSSGALYCSSSTAATLASTTYFQSSGKTNDGSPSGTATTSTWNLTTGTNTLAVWFQTSAATGGVLASLASGTTYVDRALWVDSSGNVAFGGRNASAGWSIASSGTDYTDGRWHLAAAVMGTTGATLYVDGAQKATSPSGGYYATTNGATSTTWRVGTPAVTTSGVVPTSMPADAFIGNVDEFALLHTGLAAGLLSQGYSSSVSTVTVTPPTADITSATVGTRKTATSVAIAPPVANATSVSIAPNTSITSASIAPHKAISSSTITPQKVVSALTTTPQTTIAASLIPQKAISALGITPQTSITSASIKPNATISSASIAPHKAISSSSLSPQRAINTASITPVASIAASIIPRKAISALGITPQTSITSASIKPNATISSASIAPHKAISSSSLTPQRAINTASITPVASISSSTITPVSTLGTMSISPTVSVSRGQLPTTSKTVTALALTSAAVTSVSTNGGTTVTLTASCPGGNCNSANSGYRTGDYVYVNLVTCSTCSVGFTGINGWRAIASSRTTTFTITMGANQSFASDGKTVSSGSVVQDTVVATATGHGFSTNDTINMAVNNTSIDGSGYTITATTTNSITFDLNRTTTSVPTTTVSNSPATAVAVEWATTATITAANSFAVSDSVTVAGFSGGSPLNGTFTIASATSTTFTFAVTAYNGSVDFNPSSGTATVPISTLSVVTASAHQFTSGKVVTLAVPATVTNYDQLNTKTCTVLASPAITSTAFSCTLSSAASANVSLTSADAATASVGLTTLPITTAATHGFTSGDTVVLAVPSTVTNYAQLSGKTCLVLASPTITGTTFSCTLSSAATSNVTVTSSDGATASPQKGIASASLSPMSSISAASVSPIASIS